MDATADSRPVPTIATRCPEPLDYEPTGRHVGFEVGEEGNVIGAYTVGDRQASSAIVVVPDIFGWRLAHTRRMMDELSAALGAERSVLCCPDLHRGNYIETCTEEVALGDGWQDWWGSHDLRRVTRDLHDVCGALLQGGVRRLLLVCQNWGALAVAALLRQDLPSIAAAVFICPLQLPQAQLHGVSAPVHVMLAGADPGVPLDDWPAAASPSCSSAPPFYDAPAPRPSADPPHPANGGDAPRSSGPQVLVFPNVPSGFLHLRHDAYRVAPVAVSPPIGADAVAAVAVNALRKLALLLSCHLDGDAPVHTVE